jgi:hypothetical protein
MKLKLIVLYILLTFSPAAHGEEHDQHAKHNMLIFGRAEIYASHLLYKVPHNYQVMLKLELPPAVENLYLKERVKHPADKFIFLLDEMNISQIEKADGISASIFRRDRAGEKHVLVPRVELESKDFIVLYLNELPLSLE